MAISIVQTLALTASTSTTSLQSAAFGAPVTGGNTIIVIALGGSASGSANSVSDTESNNYTTDRYELGSTDQNAVIFRSSDVTGGSNFKITVGCSATIALSFLAIEVAGLANNSPIDNSATSTNGGSTSVTSGSLTTTSANDLIIFAAATTQAPSSTPSGFTLAGEETNATYQMGAAFYEIVSSTQSGITPSFSLGASGAYGAVTIAYKAAYTEPQTPVVLVSGSSASTTGAFSLAGGDLVLFDVAPSGTGTAPTFTWPSGLTPSVIESESATTNGHYLYGAQASAALSGVAITWSTTTCYFQVIGIAGTNGVPTNASINTSSQSSPASSGALGSGMAGTSMMLGFFAFARTGVMGTDTFTAEAGSMTALNTVGAGTGTHPGLFAEYSSALGSPSTTCTASWSGLGSPTVYDVIAVEVAAPSSSTNVSSSLGGQTATFSQGSLAVEGDDATALTGQTATFAQGSPGVSGNVSPALAGQTATFSQGAPAVGVGPDVALAGMAMTAGQGALSTTGSAAAAWTGMAATFGQGSLATAGDLLVELPGLTIVSSQGSIGAAPDADEAPAGMVMFAASGGLDVAAGPGTSVGLAGLAMVAGQGTLTIDVDQSVGLVGQVATFGQGSIGPPGGDVNLELAGLVATFSQGAIVVTAASGAPAAMIWVWELLCQAAA